MQPIENGTVAELRKGAAGNAAPTDCCLLMHPMPPAPKRKRMINPMARGQTLRSVVALARRDGAYRNGAYLVKRSRRSWKRKSRS